MTSADSSLPPRPLQIERTRAAKPSGVARVRQPIKDRATRLWRARYVDLDGVVRQAGRFERKGDAVAHTAKVVAELNRHGQAISKSPDAGRLPRGVVAPVSSASTHAGHQHRTHPALPLAATPERGQRPARRAAARRPSRRPRRAAAASAGEEHDRRRLLGALGAHARRDGHRAHRGQPGGANARAARGPAPESKARARSNDARCPRRRSTRSSRRSGPGTRRSAGRPCCRARRPGELFAMHGGMVDRDRELIYLHETVDRYGRLMSGPQGHPSRRSTGQSAAAGPSSHALCSTCSSDDDGAAFGLPLPLAAWKVLGDPELLPRRLDARASEGRRVLHAVRPAPHVRLASARRRHPPRRGCRLDGAWTSRRRPRDREHDHARLRARHRRMAPESARANSRN